MTAMSNPCRLLMGRLWRLWRLVEVEEVLDGEVGQAPQLYVRSGAVARWHEPPVVDRIAPQLGVSPARRVHRTGAQAQRVPWGGRMPRPYITSAGRPPQCSDA